MSVVHQHAILELPPELANDEVTTIRNEKPNENHTVLMQ